MKAGAVLAALPAPALRTCLPPCPGQLGAGSAWLCAAGGSWAAAQSVVVQVGGW